MIPIAGYADRWSVGHNETIEFKVSSELNEPYSVKLVRMTCTDPNPDGPGIIEHDLNAVFSGQFPSRKQPAKLRSYGFVPVNGNLPHCAGADCSLRSLRFSTTGGAPFQLESERSLQRVALADLNSTSYSGPS